MARYDLSSEAIADFASSNPGDIFFHLGMMYSVGRTVPTDRVAAHKWFNLAAMKGNRDAVRLRRELSEEMSETDIAAAQRAAREWLSTH
jgi:TPR repeat protein